MFLSIIIPVYNVEPYLRECLESVFAQDLTDCEVIAVNDGSTDGSRAILEEYKIGHPEIMTVIDKANGGLSSARNEGVVFARGDYFYFLDSDDFLKTHAVTSIKQAINVSDNSDVIYLDCVVTDKGKRLWTHKERTAPVMSFRAFFQYSYEHGMGVAPNAFAYVYSSTYWRKADLHYEEGITYEDSLFKYQLFVKEDGTIKTAHIESPFYVYRERREGSLSTKLTLKNFTDRQFVRSQMAKLFDENRIKDESFRHSLYDHGLNVLLEAYEGGFLSQRKLFWSKQDYKWMAKGVSNCREYSLYLLARISPRCMARYYFNVIPKAIRRVINIMLTLTVRLFYK